MVSGDDVAVPTHKTMISDNVIVIANDRAKIATDRIVIAFCDHFVSRNNIFVPKNSTKCSTHRIVVAAHVQITSGQNRVAYTDSLHSFYDEIMTTKK